MTKGVNNISESRKIKGLKSQLNSLSGDLDAIKIELSNKKKDYELKRKNFFKLKEEIKKLEKKSNIRVSEHAVIRYFERVKGYNISDIEKEILSEDVLDLVKTLGGNGKYPNKDYQVVMKNHTVTTIITK